jgi:outer membrane receptor protein involved in Fe transport
MPETDVLLSYIHSDRNGDQELVTTGPRIDERNDETGDQIESQVLFRRDAYSLIAGGGAYHVDVDREFNFDFSPAPCLIPTGCEVTSTFDREQQNLYLYGNLALPSPVTWTVGFGYDWYEQRDLDIDKLSPKLGAQWDITDRVRLRAAAFETVKRDLIASQTIEPTQIAGFNQFFDDLNGTKARRYGLGLDARLTGQVYGGLEASWRELDTPTFEGDSVTRAKWDEELYRAYIYWTPHDQWAVSAELIWDGFKSADEEPNVDIPAEVKTASVPVTVRYFSPLGIFGQIGLTYVHQDVARRASSTVAEGHDDFVLLDATVGYRLPQRRGIFSLEARNLLDSGFDYQDDNYRSNEPRTPGYLPERIILGRLTLTF